MRRILFFFFLGLLLVTFFTRDRFKNVTDINPELYREPIQTEVSDSTPFMFKKDGFEYTVTPRFNYDMTGLVVHEQAYDQWFSLSRTDTVFPLDLCVIWGENVKNGYFRQDDLTFSQDFRFCMYKYRGNTPLIHEEIANNHIVIQDDDLDKIAKSIKAGDQIRIVGKLVDINARPLESPERFEPSNLIWTTSVVREDTGAGACETIFVESVEILKKGNYWSSLLFTISLYGIIGIFLWSFCEVFWEAYKPVRPSL